MIVRKVFLERTRVLEKPGEPKLGKVLGLDIVIGDGPFFAILGRNKNLF